MLIVVGLLIVDIPGLSTPMPVSKVSNGKARRTTWPPPNISMEGVGFSSLGLHGISAAWTQALPLYPLAPLRVMAASRTAEAIVVGI
jgi:hypothetical protein